MAWPTPQFSKGDINRAGAILAKLDSKEEELEWAHAVLGNWRACHGYPINTFQATLRDKLKKMDETAIVAQRLKRTPSIISKLRRFDKMNLARMQDIGGLRTVVSSVAKVRELQMSYKESKFRHKLVSEKDYIAEPKCDGYRSAHLVYKYDNPNAKAYDGLCIELQIRTKLQHAWATAVETMGIFLDQALKSSQGEREWLQFFEITGSAFAFKENTPRVPGYETLNKKETFQRLMESERKLGVLTKLKGFSVATQVITSKPQSAYHLITLDTRARTVSVGSYAIHNLELANSVYQKTEARVKNGEPLEVVLVSVGSITSLRKAYPNYFLDTEDFLKNVESIIKIATQS